MKYDEKTGEKKPESRIDEIKLSHEKLHELSEKTGGLLDRDMEMNWVLRDINVSLALLTDMMGVLLNNTLKDNVCLNEEVEKDYDKRTQ